MEIQARIPKGLLAALKRIEDKVSFVDYGDGYCTDTGMGYEVGLRAGWCFNPGEHIFLEQTAKDMQRRLTDIKPCECDECRLGLA